MKINLSRPYANQIDLYVLDIQRHRFIFDGREKLEPEYIADLCKVGFEVYYINTVASNYNMLSRCTLLASLQMTVLMPKAVRYLYARIEREGEAEKQNNYQISLKNMVVRFLNIGERYDIDSNIELELKANGIHFAGFYVIVRYYGQDIAVVSAYDSHKGMLSASGDLEALKSAKVLVFNQPVERCIDSQSTISHRNQAVKFFIENCSKLARDTNLLLFYTNELALLDNFMFLQKLMSDHRFVVISPSFADLLYTSVVQLEYINKEYTSAVYTKTPKFYADFDGLIASGHLVIKESLENFYDAVNEKYGEYSKDKKVYFVNFNEFGKDAEGFLECMIRVTGKQVTWSDIDPIKNASVLSTKYADFYVDLQYKIENDELSRLCRLLMDNQDTKKLIFAPAKDSIKPVDSVNYWHGSTTVKLNLLISDQALSPYSMSLCEVNEEADGIIKAKSLGNVTEQDFVDITCKNSFKDDLKKALRTNGYKILDDSDTMSIKALNANSLNLVEISLQDQLIDIKVVDAQEKTKIQNLLSNLFC